MRHFWQDVRYGLRMLGKNPGFTAIAALTLALGIGANTAIFSIVNAVLLRPLPFPQPGQLVSIRDVQTNLDSAPASFPEYLDWKGQGEVFSHVAAYFQASYALTGTNEAVQLTAMRASSNLFPMLGIQPILGRSFTAEEDKRSSERVVLLSHSLWQSRMGGDPAVVGRTMLLDGQPHTIVGVLPPSFRSVLPGDLPANGNLDVWIPLRLQDPGRGLHFMSVVGRLRDGVGIEQARQRMTVFAKQLQEQGITKHSILLVPLKEFAVGDTRPELLVLLGAVAFVLLIACANVANLLLARTTSRRREIAVRLALGAGRRRVVAQLLTESVLLALVGGALGLLIAYWSADVFAALGPRWLPSLHDAGIDNTVLAFALGVSVLVGVLFGLAPALQATRSGLYDSLKEGGRQPGGQGGRHPLRGVLVVAEVALSLTLLIGAGLLIESFIRLMNVDKGFEQGHALTFHLSLPEARYPQPQQQARFFEDLLKRMNNLPGVEAAGGVNNLPLDGGTNGSFEIEGKPFPPDEGPLAEKQIVTSGYFRALKVPLLQGRFFTPADAQGAPNVMIINRAFAERFFPGESPIGKHVAFSWDLPGFQEVVGVIGDIRHEDLAISAPAAMYVPVLQRPESGMSLVVRANADPSAVIGGVREVVAEADKELPLSDLATLESILSRSVAERRLSMAFLAGFAGLALFLAVIGVYGVISYSVGQRTHEIGIRMALGAQSSSVLRLVLRQGMVLISIGLALGIAGALGVTRWLESQLFGVSPRDFSVFAGGAVLLALIGLAACWIPARRAMRVDPVVALRYE